MYQLIVLEDEREHAEAILRLIEAFPARSRLKTTCLSTAMDLMAYLESANGVDILLSDIELGEGEPDGVWLVGELFPPGCAGTTSC